MSGYVKGDRYDCLRLMAVRVINKVKSTGDNTCAFVL
jgi:hypothetical protein